jgi:hypothetical protein
MFCQFGQVISSYFMLVYVRQVLQVMTLYIKLREVLVVKAKLGHVR